jgi:hypothetical protein
MKSFQITAHNGKWRFHYTALASSSFEAAANAAGLFGDEPCGITVKPLQVTR